MLWSNSTLPSIKTFHSIVLYDPSRSSKVINLYVTWKLYLVIKQRIKQNTNLHSKGIDSNGYWSILIHPCLHICRIQNSIHACSFATLNNVPHCGLSSTFEVRRSKGHGFDSKPVGHMKKSGKLISNINSWKLQPLFSHFRWCFGNCCWLLTVKYRQRYAQK